MSSKAFINTMATIAIVESQVNVLMAQLKDDDLDRAMPALKAAKAACDNTYGQWPGQFDKKGMARLNTILDKFHGSVSSMEIEEFTSTGLAILESLRAKLVANKADRRRISAVSNLSDKFSAVHELFDPDLDCLSAYVNAGKLENRWSELVEAS